MKKMIIFAGAIALVGCTRESIIAKNIEYGSYSYTESTSQEYDYDVKINKAIDLNWDTAKESDRLIVIRQLLGTKCSNPLIIETTFVSRGTNVLGRELGDYHCKVKCKE